MSNNNYDNVDENITVFDNSNELPKRTRIDESEDVELNKIFNEQQEPDKTVTKLRSVIGWFVTILAAVILFAIISIFVRPGVVNGHSMEPNFYHGDRFFMVKDWMIEEYNYGDVVCVDIEGRVLIKRIIGLPGDTIVIDNYKVYRNGEELDESEYLSDDVRTLPYGFVNTFTVDEGEYFVLGDNRENSADSRMIGPVKTIMGKTWFFFKKAWFQ